MYFLRFLTYKQNFRKIKINKIYNKIIIELLHLIISYQIHYILKIQKKVHNTQKMIRKLNVSKTLKNLDPYKKYVKLLKNDLATKLSH